MDIKEIISLLKWIVSGDHLVFLADLSSHDIASIKHSLRTRMDKIDQEC